MATKLPSYLHQNRHGVFGFRVVVPRDLRLSFCRNEFRVSLRTPDKNIAKRQALALMIMTNNYFDRMRSATSVEEARAISEEFLKSLFAGASFDDATSKLEDFLPTVSGNEREMLSQLIALRRRQSHITEAKGSLLRQLAEDLQGADDGAVDGLTCDFYADAAPLVADEQRLLQELARLTLKGQQTVQEALHQRDISAQAQRFQRDKDQLAEFAASIVGKVAGTPEVPRSAPHEGVSVGDAEKTASRSIAVVVEAYAQSQVAEQNWTAKTEAETRAIFDLWLRIVQDQPLAGYGFDQHREFKNTLLRLPPNMNKSPRYRGLSIDEVIALGDAPASPNTINKSLIRVSAFFKWASAHGYSTFAPAAMNIKNPRRANEERKAFSDDDLQKLFSSRAYRFGLHKQSYMHWTPLIALYSGARLNEIAQFHLDDFQEREGIPVFSINDHGEGKRVKTAAGKRLIPIHSELIRLGLLRHVEKLRKSGQTRLFPELKARRDGYGQTVSKWFARYREQCGITEEGKVFHSFRHTVIDQLKQAGIAKEKIAALVGHEDESITFGRYGKDFQPAVMLGVVETLKFDCLETDRDEHATKGN